MIGYIYCITRDKTNKVYIGQIKSVDDFEFTYKLK